MSLVWTHPLSSITVRVYVPADNELIVNPVCPLTFKLQFKINGGSPLVIKVSIVPLVPSVESPPTKTKSTVLELFIVKGNICAQPLLSVTVAV